MFAFAFASSNNNKNQGQSFMPEQLPVRSEVVPNVPMFRFLVCVCVSLLLFRAVQLKVKFIQRLDKLSVC